jgi:hypothetical protein
VRLELTRPLWPGGFRDRVLIQPGPLQIRWDGFEPPPRVSQSRALPSELRTWIPQKSSRSESTRHPPAYEAGALPLELRKRVAGTGIAPALARLMRPPLYC